MTSLFRGSIFALGFSAALINFAAGESTSHAAATPNSADASMLMMLTDNTANLPLREGDSVFVVMLPPGQSLDRLTFVNENAQARGDLQIAVANDRLPAASDKWTAVEGKVPFTHKRRFNLSLLGVEAKYIRLAFHVEGEGRLGFLPEGRGPSFAAKENLLLLGETRDESAGKSEKTERFDFAKQNARARIVYVSSGRLPLAQRMIDGDASTGFSFHADDLHPTVVLSLGALAEVDRVVTQTCGGDGHMDVFVLHAMPRNPADLSELRPVAIEHPTGFAAGKETVTFNPRGARYLVLRWSRQAAARDGKDFASSERKGFSLGDSGDGKPVNAASGDDRFSVTEIGAFGEATAQQVAAAEGAPDLFASNAMGAIGRYLAEAENGSGPLLIPQIPIVSP